MQVENHFLLFSFDGARIGSECHPQTMKYGSIIPHTMNRYHALAVMSAVFVLVLVLAPSGMSDAANDDLPWEKYPDADYIITKDRSGSPVLSYHKPVTPSNEHPDGFEWASNTVSSGSLSLVNWSEVEEPRITVVFDGADLSELSIIRVDDASLTMKYVNVSFTMYSGSIGTLSLVTVANSQLSSLGNVYDNMFNPIADANIDLRGGKILEFRPTSSMVHVESMSVRIHTDMTIDRFLTTGTNGRYGQVEVDLLGGTVGYMANIKSRIGTLGYNLEHGSVRYFCIGADTESGSNQSLSSMSTSYVTDDVDVRIDSTVSVGYAIIGGGLINNPNVLWNGVNPRDTPARNISIEANGTEVMGDTCFMNERKTHAYQFSNYKIDGSPSTRQISQSYWSNDGSPVPVYGDDGVWSGNSRLIIPQGTSFFVNCEFQIADGGEVYISLGGRMVVTDILIVYGVVNALGELMNSSVIELRDNGKIDGTITGNGFLADYIVSQTTGESINIMSSLDTVVISQMNSRYVKEITALLLSGRYSVSIEAQISGMAFGSERFMISLKESTPSESFQGLYSLYITGIDESLLEICNVDITVPVNVSAGHSIKVYHYNYDYDDPEEVEFDRTEYGQIVIHTNKAGYFGIVLEDNGSTGSPGETNMFEVAILLARIIAVLIMMIYTVNKFREDDNGWDFEDDDAEDAEETEEEDPDQIRSD